MKLDTLLRSFDLRGVGDLARRYEEMGFDAVWSVEAGHDPFLPLARVAAATETIRFGTNVAVAFARSPMSMAQVTWDFAAGEPRPPLARARNASACARRAALLDAV